MSPSPVTMFRAGYTGTPSGGAGVWTGDQAPNFKGLRDAIHSQLPYSLHASPLQEALPLSGDSAAEAEPDAEPEAQSEA